MKISVIGMGYVGLVTATCFAQMGNQVIVIDNNKDKIKKIRQGHIPIYEPGLDEMVLRNLKTEHLVFSHKISEAARYANIHFMAVGTPPLPDGSADVSQIEACTLELLPYLVPGHHVIVNKSTVPIGTADRMQSLVNRYISDNQLSISVDVVSNPEFLKEGNAVADFMSPNRIIIGSRSSQASKLLTELYAPFTKNKPRTLTMLPRDAEMTKYAANAMLATKISFMNEIAAMCDVMGVDVEQVRVGIGSDERIGFSFIYPGCGYGGSCFPKDVNALIQTAASHEFDAQILRAVEARNQHQKKTLFQKIMQYYHGNVSGIHFALWGLSFKPGTDDLREAPAIALIEQLMGAGAIVHAHDPVAMKAARKILPEEWFESKQLRLYPRVEETLKKSHALIVCTEWPMYRSPNFTALAIQLQDQVIFDGRNVYDLAAVEAAQLDYVAIGRGVYAKVHEKEKSKNKIRAYKENDWVAG